MSAPEVPEAQWAKALSHPLRGRILQRLAERTASPGDVAAELGVPLGVVSYHVRMLRDYGMVELVRTEPRRGALQHFYRATVRRTEPDASLLSTQLAALFGVSEDQVAITKTTDDAGTRYSVEVTGCVT